jgi:hypothetical protein
MHIPTEVIAVPAAAEPEYQTELSGGEDLPVSLRPGGTPLALTMA